MDLSDGAPTEPLILPPKYMDLKTYKKMAEEIDVGLQLARDNKDADAINNMLKARWTHLFHTRPIDAESFRSRLGALLEEWCTVMSDMKCTGRWAGCD